MTTPRTTIARLVRYYEDRYEQPPGAFRDYSLYLEMLGRGPSGSRFLDIGCGEGFVLEQAHAAGMRPFGVDIVVNALREARGRAPGAGLAAAAGEALPFHEHAFERVTCLGSLEHFADPDAGLREIVRVLHPEGRALIVVPNRRFVVWSLLRRRGTEQREIAELLLDEREWSARFRAAGLRIVDVAKEPWYSKPYRSRVLRWGLRAAWTVIPRRWTYQFAFLCEPEPDARAD